jgi:uncharacterized spore protein YtfJ
MDAVGILFGVILGEGIQVDNLQIQLFRQFILNGHDLVLNDGAAASGLGLIGHVGGVEEIDGGLGGKIQIFTDEVVVVVAIIIRIPVGGLGVVGTETDDNDIGIRLQRGSVFGAFLVGTVALDEGGGGGFSGKLTPSAVLVIKNGSTKLVNIKNQDTMTKILDMVPDLIEKITASKEDMISDDEAVDVAFPEESK